MFDLRESLAEGDRGQAWSTARAQAHRGCHLSHSSLNSLGAQLASTAEVRRLQQEQGMHRHSLNSSCNDAVECCPGKTQPEHHTWIVTGREDLAKGSLVCGTVQP